ncbi:helix-turn-helix transcriptional regulator [Paenibacillus sp. FSL M7-1455]|uniref:helix-turn-helix transcriptional regulator n=1 Tax=Paenibacillus sp. FSL M7-1455 TaxID=2975316 RepID=UPI0030F56A65
MTKNAPAYGDTPRVLERFYCPKRQDEAGHASIDATNFIRKFKKNEGPTPIQYRTVVRAERPREEASL